MKLDSYRRAILTALFFGYAFLNGESQADQPNILWIVVEDASPNLSAYGETAIKTPTWISSRSRGSNSKTHSSPVPFVRRAVRRW